MLANAISSAVDRLYAAKPVADERSMLPRVGAVSPVARVKAVSQDDAERELGAREERDRIQHRQALTRGVLAVFESTAANEAGSETGSATDKDGGDRPAAVDMTAPDPVLEAAILRFIHSMFRTLAAEEPAEGQSKPATNGGDKSPFQISNFSREALGARIEALAQRLGDGQGPTQPGEDAKNTAALINIRSDTAPTAPDQSLQQAFAEVVQALRGNLGGAEPQAQSTRAELVSMMQRLAQAMHGAPPIDPGLPTRGGLLSATA